MFRYILEGEWPGSRRFISASGSKSSSKPVRVGMWAPGQEETFETLWPTVAGGLEEAAPTYPKSMYVPKTTEEQAYLEAIPGLAGEVGAARGRLGQPAFQITLELSLILNQPPYLNVLIDIVLSVADGVDE